MCDHDRKRHRLRIYLEVESPRASELDVRDRFRAVLLEYLNNWE